MRRVMLLPFSVAAVSAAAVLLPSSANAAVTINIGNAGPNVVATATGSISTAAITGLTCCSISPITQPDTAWISFNSFFGLLHDLVLTGPSSFGPGVGWVASSSSGTAFLFEGNTGTLAIDFAYVLGSPLAATDTFAGQSLASMGFTPGTYVYSILNGNGAPVDTLTVNIGGGVPEPATWAMMLLGFGWMGYAMRKQRVSVPQLG